MVGRFAAKKLSGGQEVSGVGDREPQFLRVGDGGATRRIAYLADPPAKEPPVSLFWLSGYRSDMASTKAAALAEFARQKGYGCTRFDYSGHGVSSGRFEDGTIGQWLAEAEAVFRRATRGPQIIVGSSMGGWIALLLLRRLLREAPAEASRMAGLVLIAPAWDMTEELMWKKFDAAARTDLEQTGVYNQPSEYGEPYAITRGLIEEGREHLLARRPFDPGRPVVILQGALDAAVPIAHTRELMGFMKGGGVVLHEIADAEHRLSRPEDLALLFASIEQLADRAGPLPRR
jgi:pimeloyl-ACP methyl ester carboxylesterase